MTRHHNQTPPLFADHYPPPPVPRDAPETSREAAESIAPRTSRLAERVLTYIRGANGATCFEIEEGLEMAHQTASARVWELRKAGRIRDSGVRRKTGSGRRAVVWTLKRTEDQP